MHQKNIVVSQLFLSKESWLSSSPEEMMAQWTPCRGMAGLGSVLLEILEESGCCRFSRRFLLRFAHRKIC